MSSTVHHPSCPKSLAWDIEDVPCECPKFWPRRERAKGAGPDAVHYEIACGEAQRLSFTIKVF